MAIKHKFTSDIDDAGIPAEWVKPGNWNDDHQLDGLLALLDGLGVLPNSIPYVDGGGNGATLTFSAFFQSICGSANAAALLAAIGAAALASPAFTGNPTAPTQLSTDNSTRLATTAYVQAKITALVNGSPGALDTLNELATALGDDANFATTMTDALALKAPLASPTFTGTPAAPTATPGDNTTKLATTAFVAAALATVGSAVLYGSSQSLTSAQQKQARGNIGTSIGIPDVIIQEQQTSGTNAGTGTVGSFADRSLNTSVRNVLTGASLASNHLTLPAGSYYARWSAPAYSTNGFQSRLQNITDGTTIAQGQSGFTAVAAGVVENTNGGCFFTLAASKAIALQMQIQTTNANSDLGRAASMGTEVYSRLEIYALS